MINIREAEIKDAETWSKLRTELWPNTNDDHRSEINVRNFAEGSRRSKVPYIEAWLVDPEKRGEGVGKALIQKAEQWACSRGYSELASDTDLTNVASISIHKHMGFTETERIVCFIKSLKNA
ncbi:GNAT family N-acetyltransferase [Marinobacterium lacunae]|uniref:GNAT family N-acetyltransferase n=1 Tax=Marinobacterium lacunae TaxID=1232683 RepID=UPI001E3601F7|nr:GNAT family N-acetyltransferase [Marinobacterium lacunae]